MLLSRGKGLFLLWTVGRRGGRLSWGGGGGGGGGVIPAAAARAGVVTGQVGGGLPGCLGVVWTALPVPLAGARGGGLFRAGGGGGGGGRGGWGGGGGRGRGFQRRVWWLRRRW